MDALPPRTFPWINLFSALSRAIIFSLTGFLFGKGASLFIEDMGRYEHYLALVLMGFVTCAWLLHMYHVWRTRKPARDRLARMRAHRATRSFQQ